MKAAICFGLLLALAAPAAEITVEGGRFLLDGRPFPYTGVSFFNALYNAEFNRGDASRGQWLDKFRRYGINVLRVWGQWSMTDVFADACPECTLYHPDGSLRGETLERLKRLASAADERGMVIEFVLFSQEVVRRGTPLTAEAGDRAAGEVARALLAHRNVTLQIWNEYDERVLERVKIIKAIDPKRLVTNSPGFAGVLTGVRGEAEALDYLTPHTTRRRDGKNWGVAAAEIRYLRQRYGKPVVDDEPGRNGTPKHGGPQEATSPYDHIAQAIEVWRAGGYVTYHHDMFQLGYGSPSVPPSGIPDPEFSPYHRVVFEFLAQRERYMEHFFRP